MNEALLTILYAATPIGEIRLALPLAITVYEMPIVQAFALSFLGNILPIFPLIFGLRRLRTWSDRHIPIAHRFLDWFFARTERHWRKGYEKYGAFVLFLFVAVPFPLTGAWSGCAAAVLFNIRPKYAIPAIMGGVFAAGLIVLAITTGAIHLFS